MVTLVVFKVFLVVKNLEKLIQIVPDSPIYYYSCGTDIPTVISESQAISAKVFDWFGNNHMKTNPVKCHLLLSTKSHEVVSIDGIQIKSNTTETIRY